MSNGDAKSSGRTSATEDVEADSTPKSSSTSSGKERLHSESSPGTAGTTENGGRVARVIGPNGVRSKTEDPGIAGGGGTQNPESNPSDILLKSRVHLEINHSAAPVVGQPNQIQSPIRQCHTHVIDGVPVISSDSTSLPSKNEVSSSYSTPIRSRAGGSVGQESPSTVSVEERREGDGEVDTTRWKSRLQRVILTQTSSGHVTPNPGSEVGEGESRGSVGEDSQQSPRSRGPYGSSGSDMEDAGSVSLRETGGPKQAGSLDTALRGKAPQEVSAYTERTDNSSPPSWKKRLNKVLHN
eukprot:gene188-190_t